MLASEGCGWPAAALQGRAAGQGAGAAPLCPDRSSRALATFKFCIQRNYPFTLLECLSFIYHLLTTTIPVNFNFHFHFFLLLLVHRPNCLHPLFSYRLYPSSPAPLSLASSAYYNPRALLCELASTNHPPVLPLSCFLHHERFVSTVNITPRRTADSALQLLFLSAGLEPVYGLSYALPQHPEALISELRDPHFSTSMPPVCDVTLT